MRKQTTLLLIFLGFFVSLQALQKKELLIQKQNQGFSTYYADAYSSAESGLSYFSLKPIDFSKSIEEVQNIMAPTIVCKNITVQLDDDGKVSIAEDAVHDSSTGTGNLSFDTDITDFTCSNIGDITVVLTVTDDDGGLTATCIATVTVKDITPPTITCPTNITTNNDPDKCYASGVAIVEPTATDNCSTSGFTYTGTRDDNQALTANYPLGITTITWTAKDESGNGSTSCTQTVTVNDNQAPTFTNCPSDQNVNFGSSCQFTLPDYTTTASTNDNCTALVTVTQSPAADTVINANTTIILTATDNVGNTATCSFDVLPTDNTPPTVICEPITIQLDASGNASITPADIDNGSNDTCGPVTLGFAPGPVVAAGVNIALGKPTAQSSDYKNIPNSGRAVDGNMSGDWNDNSVTHTNENENGIGQWWEVDLEAAYPITSLRIWNRTNCCSDRLNNFRITLYDGATIVATQDFTDQPSPDLIINSLTGIADRIKVTQLKNAPLSIAEFQVYSDTGTAIKEFDCDDLGANEVTLFVTDQDGNESTCISTVTILDVTVPTATNPLAINVQCAADVPAVDISVVTDAADNCSTPIVAFLSENTDGNSNPEVITRTYSVTDTTGNSINLTHTITVNDNINPTITNCPENQNVDFGTACGFTLPDYTTSVTTNDNCDTAVVLTQSPTAGSVITVDTIVTLTAKDNAGNTATCSFDVIPSDTTDPTALCKPITVQLDSSGNASIIPSNIDKGSSDTCGSVTLGFAPGPVVDPGDNIAKNKFARQSSLDWDGVPSRAVDGDHDGIYGNESITHTKGGLMPDGSKQWWEVELGAAYPITKMKIWNRTDENFGNRLRNFTVTLYNDLTVVSEATFTSQPNPSTVITNVTGIGDRIRVTQNTEDPLSIAEFEVYSDTGTAIKEFDCSNLGANEVTLFITDEAGNQSTCTSIVTVEDKTPTITCPADVTVNADSDSVNCNATGVALGTPTISDNCEIAEFTVDNNAPSIFPLGETPVTWTVENSSGKTNTCIQTVTVVDNNPPEITCPTDIVVNIDEGLCTAKVSYTAPVGTDCSDVQTVQTDTTGLIPGSAFPIGITTLEYTSTDAVGLQTSCTFTITVVDNEAPTVSAPADAEVSSSSTSCSGEYDVPEATFGDTCSTSTLSWSISGATSLSGSGQVGTQTFNIGKSTIEFTATDAAGNTASDSMTVTISDDVAPSITCPADITATANSNCEVTSLFLGVPTTSDNCGIASVTNDASPPYAIGDTTVTWTVTDNAGNKASCEQKITVEDHTKPTISLTKTNITVNTSTKADGNCTVAVAIANASFSDNCTGSSLTWEMTGATIADGSGQIPSSYPFNVGTTTIIYTVSDNAATANTATATMTIKVIDDEAPTITPLSDITTNSDTDSCGSSVQWPEPTADDNCEIQSFSQTTEFSNPYTFPIGTTTVTYVATDTSGNTFTESFDVTVTDNIAPVVTHPNAPDGISAGISEDGMGNCDVAIAISPAIISDNCGSLNATANLTWEIKFDGSVIATGNGQIGTYTFDIGISTITYTLSDNATPANTNSISFQVTVTDDELPILNLPDDITVNSCDTVVNYTVSGYDTCGSYTIIQTDGTGFTSGVVFTNEITIQTYEIRDENNNVTSGSFTVTVVDSTDPQITCPSPVTINNDPGLCSATFDYQVVATDDCASTGFSLDWKMTGATIDDGDGQIGTYSFNVGETEIAYTVTDNSGNTAKCSSIVTVKDNEKPVLTCPSVDASYPTDKDACTANLTFAPTVSDNCNDDGTDMTISYAIGANPIAFPYDFPKGSTTVKVTATDTNNNTSNCNFKVVVKDEQAPEIDCPTEAFSFDNDSGKCTAYKSPTVTATDNCTASPTTITYAIGATAITFPYLFPTGTTTVTSKAKDSSGNTVFCTYDVIVNDTEKPSAVCQNFTVTLNASGDASIDIDDINNGSTDNCGIQSMTLNTTSFDCSNLGSNTVTMTVTDTSNNVSTCTSTVTVLDPAAGSSVGISVDNNPICPGGDLTFTPIPTDGGANPIYEWFINGETQGTTANPEPTFTPFITINDGDVVYVQMQSSLSACSAPVQSNPITVTVNPTPEVSAAQDLCLGNTATLSPTSGGTWVSNNPSVASVNNSGLVTAIAAGTVTFTFTSASGGCTNTTTVLTVNPLPVVTEPATVCIADTQLLSPTSGGTWLSSNTSIATVTNAGEITGVSVGNVTFTFTNANNCKATTNSVEVLESPVISSISALENPLCAGESTTLKAELAASSNPASVMTLINYNFNTGEAYTDYDGQEATGINSTLTSSTLPWERGANGTPTEANAFSYNPNGPSLYQIDGVGSNDAGDWIFDISGANLSQYGDFSIYFQTIRNNISGTAKYINVSYRVNGTGSFNLLESIFMNINNASLSWREVLISIPALANNPNRLEIKLGVTDGYTSNSGNSPIRIDNFQVQGKIAGDVFLYSWTADTGANSGLPTGAATPATDNHVISVNPSETTNYTLTVTKNDNSCTATETVLVTVTPAPIITVNANYCPTDVLDTEDQDESNMVQLVATSNLDNVDYVWQTNPVQTGSTIYVDIADVYQVLGSVAGGCSASGSISIAQELVIDGDFTNIDLTDPSSFPFTTSTTKYIFNQPGLVPPEKGELWDGPNIYTIAEDAADTHGLIKASILDHTNNTVGPRNFMIINSDEGEYAWKQENTPVLPNTTYYFSAWIRAVLGAPYAKLRFEINGELVGSAQQATYGSWERFYGNWTSGDDVTNVNIRIKNLENASGGNDYGLDDISFATLSTFIRLTSDEISDKQIVCQNSEILPISYDIGGGLTPPNIDWIKDETPLSTNEFPEGLSFNFNGLGYTISGTPTVAGSYTYSLKTDSACDVKSINGKLTVNQAPVVTIVDITDPLCYNDNGHSVEVSATITGSATSGEWSTALGTGNFTGDSGDGNAIYNFGLDEKGLVTLTFTSDIPSGPCEAAEAELEIEIVPYLEAAAGGDQEFATCDITSVNLNANDVVGTWTVTSAQDPNSYFFSDATAHDASFTGESGETYNLQWEATNLSPCGNTVDDLVVTFADCGNNIVFDGMDDYINFGDNYKLEASGFSIEAWVKGNNFTTSSGTQTIISKRNATTPITGYDLSMVNNRLQFRWNNNQPLQSSQTMKSNKWYHVAVTFNGSSTYNMYIDGIFMQTSTSGTSPSPNNNNSVIGAMDRNNNSPTHYFNGAIDEVRIWKKALTQTQIQEMMNQEIKASGTDVMGEVIPKTISGLQWNDLMGYYQMQVGEQTVVANGTIEDITTSGVTGKLNKMATSQDESAPLPYKSNKPGAWDEANTWQNGLQQQIPNSPVNSIKPGERQTWNIVKTDHNISTTTADRTTTLLGLLVDDNKLSVIGNQGLTVTSYLKIDGKLDLVGESQLIQTKGSAFEAASIGTLERDQQGTSNLYNYNYWTSPVSDDGSTFTVGSVLKDGVDPNNPQPISWFSSHDANGTHPLYLSRRWLNTFKNFKDLYANWKQISETTSIPVGLGYTMKGSGTTDGTPSTIQNYVFVGKPNNGDITSYVNGGYQALVGNPYPSAIDANLFIEDNVSVLEIGALYFWEHAPSNNTHILKDYLGGYATLNRVGGTAAVSKPEEIGGLGDASKIPRRYIPIGQGFFTEGKASGGGSILFQNSQRIFKKESLSTSVFMRGTNDSEAFTNDDGDEEISNDQFIRLDFITPENAVRHLLIGFMDSDDASDGVDYGYDAPNNDDFPNDMGFNIDGGQYIIQGVGRFDETKSFPLFINLATGGTIQIALDTLENFEEEIDVFIYDSVTGIYTRFNDINFQITLAPGDYPDRFSLVFKEDESLSTIDTEFKEIIANFLQKTDEIYIRTPKSIQVKQVYLINITGQTVGSWNATNLPMSNEIRIPVQNISEGNYILQVETNYSTYNKKITVKY